MDFQEVFEGGHLRVGLAEFVGEAHLRLRQGDFVSAIKITFSVLQRPRIGFRHGLTNVDDGSELLDNG